MVRAVVVSLLLVAAATACGGGGKKPQTTTAAGASAAKTADAAIRSRLTKAGYTIEDASTPGAAKLAKVKGELDAFSVQADFTSPNSYHLGVTVFDSTLDLRRYLQREAAAEKQEESDPNCKLEPGCETFFHAIHGPHPPIVERPLGTVLYTGVVDKPGATLPTRSFASIVALASGSAA